jgi:ATP-dependent Clp protease, protease subunit
MSDPANVGGLAGLLAMTPPARVGPPEVYAMFCGPIDQTTVARIISGIHTVMANNVPRLHLLFQSTGGLVGEGVCLYNLFKALTVPLTLYNVGPVSSVAALAYLGAQERKVSAHATFMLHRTHISPQAAGAERLQAIAKGVMLDDERTEAILRAHITLSDDQWTEHRHQELWFSAQEAVDAGMATSIGDFAPPKGSRLYAV